MTTQQTHTDVKSHSRRTGAILTAAASAIVVLLSAGAAGGQDTTTGQHAAQPGPSNNPTYPAAAPGTPYPVQPQVAPGLGETQLPAPAAPEANPVPVEQPPEMPAPVPATPATPATTQPAARPLVADGVAADGGIKLTTGRTTIVNLRRPAARVSIGNPEIADVNVLSPTQLLVTAKKPGETGLILWDERDRTASIAINVEPDLAALRSQIKQAFPLVNVSATPLGDSIALRGLVPSQKAAEQIVEMAGTYAKVHNFLEVAGGQQVMLQIRFAEVTKSAERQLGVNFGGEDGVSAFTTTTFGGGVNSFNLAATDAASRFTYTAGAATLYGSGMFKGTPFDYFIDALEQNGLMRMLAEPNVVAINGQEASFIAGGEFPVPVSQGGSGSSAAVTVDYREYGIKLNFTPLVLGNGQIRLKVAPEVSQLDFANAVKANGFLIPALTKRKLSTTVELGDGQSFALAGLLDDTSSATVNAIPVLGDLPILGTLFRSTQWQRQQTELVVLVTPRLVAPTNPDRTAAVPGEHWRFPTDAELYLNADLGGDKMQAGHPAVDKNTKAVAPPPAFHGTYGFTAAGAGSMQPSGSGR